MNQPNLDFAAATPPLTRNDDPATSHLAEQHMRESGKLGRQQRAVWNLVVLYPGFTAKQLNSTDTAKAYGRRGTLANDMADRRYQISRRTADLKRLGLVRQERVKGLRECRWWPA